MKTLAHGRNEPTNATRAEIIATLSIEVPASVTAAPVFTKPLGGGGGMRGMSF
jgi:hypothetical protein